jgi:uncharacterized protein YcaQ
MTKSERVTLSAARRIALRAHGFGRPRPARPGLAHVRRAVDALGLVQIDYVNVLAPAHHLVLFSRLGPYDSAHLATLLFERRELFEHWAHEASILPVDAWPLLRHRMAGTPRRGPRFARFAEEHGPYLAEVLETVRTRGPLTAAELAGEAKRHGAWWGWSRPKTALEALLAHGHVGVASRRTAGFARVYDLSERVIPRPVHGASIEPAEAQRELVRRAAARVGVGTVKDLADYFRMPNKDAADRVAELVRAGELVPVAVEGWKDRAYRPADAPSSRPLAARSILSPFDPVVWCRPRNERLFDFHYRIEIYTPAAKRRFGYYVLPFLLGDRIVGRVDLKADHAAGRLRVLAAHREAHAGDEVAGPLAEELAEVARWLELPEIEVARKGDLAGALRKAT